MKLKFFFSLLLVGFIAIAHGQESNNLPEEIQEEPPQIGNFIFPSSEQPGPLISFGQNIIDKNQIQFFLEADKIGGVNKHTIDVVPSVLYGVTDNFSIFFNLPIAASFKDKAHQSSGLEDAFLQFEYAFYAYQNHNYTDQATVVTNMTFPTGSADKRPNTGFGSPSFFLGTTFNRIYVKWFLFTSYGTILTTEDKDDETKFGNQFLYQAGFGRNLFNIDSKWIFAGLVETDGTYAEKNKINGATDPNSGGNVVYVTPSLWISSKNLVFQLGAGMPVTQHLYGDQGKNRYLLEVNLGWTF